jgi:hypothetical protein
MSSVLECGELRVAFDWRVDRYGHRIEQLVDGQWRPVLESLEGSSDDDWPPSPALQDIHIEERSTARVALLVGKSGTSHWSVSVEPIAARRAFAFDIACRIHRSPQWLGSVYRAIAGRPPPIDIAPLPCETICHNEPPNQWRIRPVEFAPQRPSTIRWRYSIGLKIPEPR